MFSSAPAKMMEREPLVNKKGKTNSAVRQQQVNVQKRTLVHSELMLGEQVVGTVVMHCGSHKTLYK